MKFRFLTTTILSASLMAGITLSLSSCNKDDDNTSDEQDAPEVKIEQETLTHGIETDMKSAEISVPIDCEGQWHATITAGTSWVRIEGWQVTYTGKQTLTLLFDENLSKVDRNTTLNITNADGEIQHIAIKQYYNYEGKAPTNGNGLAFAGKGLGTAIDYDYALNMKKIAESTTPFEPTKIHGLNNVLNMTRIEQLKKNGSLQPSAYVEAVTPIADLKAKLLDSCVMQNKHLDLSFDLGIEFGPIAVTCHGAYDSDKAESRAYVDYTIVRTAPMYNAYVSPAELAAYATDAKNNKIDWDADEAEWDAIDELIERFKKANQRLIKRGKELELNEDGLTPEQAIEIANMEAAIPLRYDRAGIFSTNFNDRYNQLYNAIVRPANKETGTDKTEVKNILDALNDEYGPFIIAGGDYGGALTMYCQIDTMLLDGRSTFEGEMSAEFGGYLHAEGTLHYTEDGYARLRNINPQINIYGGNANNVANSMLEIITGGNATELPKWTEILSNWLDSMKETDEDEENLNAPSPISYVVTPIWTFFREPAIQQQVRDYFVEKYADRGIKAYLGIMDGSDDTGAEQILNKDSKFWK